MPTRRPRPARLQHVQPARPPAARCNADERGGRKVDATGSEPRLLARHGQNERSIAQRRKKPLISGRRPDMTTPLRTLFSGISVNQVEGVVDLEVRLRLSFLPSLRTLARTKAFFGSSSFCPSTASWLGTATIRSSHSCERPSTPAGGEREVSSDICAGSSADWGNKCLHNQHRDSNRRKLYL
jgi:hypothetical protein